MLEICFQYASVDPGVSVFLWARRFNNLTSSLRESFAEHDGNGADWLRGGFGDSAAADQSTDIIFAGSMTARDAVTGLYAESEDNAVEGAPLYFATHTYRLWAAQFDDALNANILEGNGGDDILVASNAKDVFLYKLTEIPASQTVGTDTIHNFRVGQDKIAVVTAFNTGADYTYVRGESE